MNSKKKNIVAISALTIALGTLTTLQAEQNPFTLKSFAKPQDNAIDIAMGSCGQGMCGGNSGGMGSGNMPQGIPPTLLPNNASDGAQALINNCAQCHGLPAPGMHTAEEWPSVVQRMKMHIKWSKKWMPINVPNDKELTALLDYLQEHAQKPIDANAYLDLNTESGKDFSQICVQCHVLPDPKQHNEEDWPTVVDRMLGYMTVQKKQVPNKQQTEKIVEYLKKNANKS